MPALWLSHRYPPLLSTWQLESIPMENSCKGDIDYKGGIDLQALHLPVSTSMHPRGCYPPLEITQHYGKNNPKPCS